MSHSDPFEYGFSIGLEFPRSFSMPEWIQRYVTKGENGWLHISDDFSLPPLLRFIEELADNGARLTSELTYCFYGFQGQSDDVCGFALTFRGYDNGPDTFLLNPESDYDPKAPHGGARRFGLLPDVSPNLVKRPYGKLSKANGGPIMPRMYFKALESFGVSIGSNVHVKGKPTVWHALNCRTHKVIDPEFTNNTPCYMHGPTDNGEHQFRHDYGILVALPDAGDSFGWAVDHHGWGCSDYERLFVLDCSAYDFLHPNSRKMAGYFSMRPIYLPNSPEAQFLRNTQEAIHRHLDPKH